MRNELSGLQSDEREQALEFILSATAVDLRGPGALSLARRLGRVREALREQLPRSVLTNEQPYAVHIDSIYAVDHQSFWVKGWVHDEDRMLESLVAVSPEGGRADLLDGAYRHSRLDIEELYAPASDIANERHGLIKFSRARQLQPPAARLGGGAAHVHRRGPRGRGAAGRAVARDGARAPARRHHGGASR